MSTRLQGLPPVADARTRFLVLGSFPGVRSLQRQQYYAHPQNQFWKILQALWPHAPWPADGDYAARCASALALGLGIWDVYAACEREGSLDSAIRDPVLNDFPALLSRCPLLEGVGHNGGESHRHARAVSQALELAGLQTGLEKRVQIHKLPSTSPANASWSFDRKREAWQAVMQHHGLL